MPGITQQALDKIGEVAVSVARIEERMIRFDEISTELTKAIKGNGKPGLLDRVSCIETQHANEAKSAEKKEANKTKWDLRAWAIVMLFIGQVVILIFK